MILKTPIHKFEKAVLLFRRTHEAAVRSSKILVVFRGDLGAAFVAQKDSQVKFGLELRNIVSLAELLLHHEDKTKIINIIQKRSRYHLDPIEE